MTSMTQPNVRSTEPANSDQMAIETQLARLRLLVGILADDAASNVKQYVVIIPVSDDMPAVVLTVAGELARVLDVSQLPITKPRLVPITVHHALAAGHTTDQFRQGIGKAATIIYGMAGQVCASIKNSV
jgi:hypothetical protein